MQYIHSVSSTSYDFTEKIRVKTKQQTYLLELKFHGGHFKGAPSYFSKSSFLIHLKNHHSKDVNLNFQLKRSRRLNVQGNFVDCSCL